MMKRAFFSVFAAASAMAVAGTPLAAGQHSDDHAHPGHGQQMQQHMHGSDAADHHSVAGAEVNGRPCDPAKVSRVVDMTMDDTMRFTPDRITVKAGETVRFFLKNTGKVPHEFVIGSMDELREHAEVMRRMPEMKHEEPNSITLAPRQIGAVVWQFERPGTVDFACLVPGHFEAGMVGKVQVE